MLILTCAQCHEPYADDDRFCRVCGHDLHTEHLPEAAASRAVVPWRGAVPSVLQGMAVAGSGVAPRYLLPKLAGPWALRPLQRGRRCRIPY